MSHIAFVLGKPPKSSTIFPEVFDRLVTAGVETSVHLPHDGKVEEVVLSNATLVVHRGLDDTALRLVRDLHLGGTTLVNSYPGVLKLADRVAMLRALDGLPVPPTRVVSTWQEVAAAAGDRRCVVKSAVGPGRGAAIVVGTAEGLRIDRGLEPPFLVQDYVLADDSIEEYLRAAVSMIRLAMTGYRREGKRYMTIAVGCTGGKHRSVAISESLAGRLSGLDSVEVHVRHRDLGRE